MQQFTDNGHSSGMPGRNGRFAAANQEGSCKMRNYQAGSIMALAAMLAFSSAALAQAGQGQGGQAAGANQGRRAAANAPSPTANLPYDAHDFSGVWMGRENRNTLGKSVPPMTPWAQARFDAAKPGQGPRMQPLGNDPIMVCDPIGYPRIAFYNDYPMEFVQTKDRLLEFFDFYYVHRTIWMDGRKLPDDPDPTWYGYSVGHWDGSALVVETTGFNDESWIDNLGHPHSDEMKLEERFQRVDHDTILGTMTLTDPKAYTAPWVSEATTWKWAPKQAMREDLCAPSDESKYKDEMRQPAATKN
jgi:hypothetical protein